MKKNEFNSFWPSVYVFSLSQPLMIGMYSGILASLGENRQLNFPENNNSIRMTFNQHLFTQEINIAYYIPVSVLTCGTIAMVQMDKFAVLTELTVQRHINQKHCLSNYINGRNIWAGFLKVVLKKMVNILFLCFNYQPMKTVVHFMSRFISIYTYVIFPYILIFTNILT